MAAGKAVRGLPLKVFWLPWPVFSFKPRIKGHDGTCSGSAVLRGSRTELQGVFIVGSGSKYYNQRHQAPCNEVALVMSSTLSLCPLIECVGLTAARQKKLKLKLKLKLSFCESFNNAYKEKESITEKKENSLAKKFIAL
jgi:hypothetical protein